jgi:hypothetical protein
MIALTKIRDLDIEPTAVSRPAFVYAASGLARLGNRLYIVADDELHLAMFDFHGKTPGSWLRLCPGKLPDEYMERKRQKPDLESITHITAHQYATNGALLVVPSMSTERRTNGVLVMLGENQGLTEVIIPINFSAIREVLKPLLNELNIEGAIVNANTVKLFHRGSKGKSKSAIIELDAQVFLKDLHDSHMISAEHISKITECDLGDIDGVPLHFTDAVTLPDERVLFLSTAEDTNNAYEDGEWHGSAVGIIDKACKVERITRFNSKEKLEGVSVSVHPQKLELLLVSDTDDQSKPAGLYRSTMSF